MLRVREIKIMGVEDTVVVMMMKIRMKVVRMRVRIQVVCVIRMRVV